MNTPSVKATLSPLHFKQVTLADRALFERFVYPSQCRNCDMSFANIFCWQGSYNSQIAVWGGFLIIRFTTENGQYGYMQPIGQGDRQAVIQALKADAAQAGMPFRMYGLDEEWSAFLDATFNHTFAIAPIGANADYIYLSSDLSQLPGRKYQPKRNHINRFVSRYNYRFETIGADNIEDCLYLNTLWCCEKGELCNSAEQRAIQLFFDNFNALPIEGWILYADNNPAAFAIGSAINHDTFCIHIEKIDNSYEGAGAMINNLVAVELESRYRYINREDDLGIEGLRRAKQSYHPIELLQKRSALLLNDKELQIRELWKEVFGDSREDIDHFLVRFYNPSRCFTHSIAGKVISMLHLVPLSYGNTQSGYIYAVATAEPYRGQGVASTLINRAIEYSKRAKKYHNLLLIPANEQASRLYARSGFCHTDELFRQPDNAPDYDFGSGKPERDFVMMLKIL